MEINNSITLIDDDSSILDLIEIYLDDFETFKINNLGDLENHLKTTHDLHLFISDIELGGEDSKKAYSKIKSYNPLSVIIGISGHSSFEKKKSVLEAGYDDYFIKPIKFDILKNVLNFHIEKYRRWIA